MVLDATRIAVMPRPTPSGLSHGQRSVTAFPDQNIPKCPDIASAHGILRAEQTNVNGESGDGLLQAAAPGMQQWGKR
jgi:hypothetical protein